MFTVEKGKTQTLSLHFEQSITVNIILEIIIRLYSFRKMKFREEVVYGMFLLIYLKFKFFLRFLNTL